MAFKRKKMLLLKCESMRSVAQTLYTDVDYNIYHIFLPLFIFASKHRSLNIDFVGFVGRNDEAEKDQRQR